MGGRSGAGQVNDEDFDRLWEFDKKLKAVAAQDIPIEERFAQVEKLVEEYHAHD
jgi:hypothetical protein